MLGACCALADELPASLDKPFLGCWVAFADSRDFEFLIGGDGTSELFFKDGKTRLKTGGCTVNVYYALEEQVKEKGGKTRWINRAMKEDGFEDFDPETAEPALGKAVSFTATYTGGIKVRVSHFFTKDGVEIATKLLEKGSSKNDMRVGVRVLVGDMFRHIKDEDLEDRTTKSKLKESRIAVLPADSKRSSGKRIKFEDYELNLTELFPKGATRFSLESDRIADHEYELSTANPDYGLLEFRQTKKLLHGFLVNWWPDPEKTAEKDCRLVIEVK